MGFFDDLAYDVENFRKVMQNATTQLVNISNQLSQVTSTAPGQLGVTTVRTASYNGHNFLVAPIKAQANAQKYELQHYADAVVVTCPYDFQVDFDNNVSDTTPATASYSLPSFELRVNDFISYKLAPNVPNVQTTQAPFYMWLFWYQ